MKRILIPHRIMNTLSSSVLSLLFVLSASFILSTSAYANPVAQNLAKPKYDAAVNAVLPLTPDQIRQLKNKNLGLVEASQMPIITSPVIQNTVETVNLSGGVQSQAIRMVSGYVTDIYFIGENGKPWQVDSAVPGGDAISVNPSSKDDPYTSSLKVNDNKIGSTTNVAFHLRGRVQPVILYFSTASDPSRGLDSDVTIKVDGLAPGTSPLTVKNVTAVSDELLNTLDHAPAGGWKEVGLNNTDIPVHVHYWIAPDHKKAIVRLSSGTLVMPEWGSQASSPDNTTTAYEFNYVPLMLWINSDDGQSFQVKVSDSTQLIAGGTPAMQVTNVSPSQTPRNLAPIKGYSYAK